MNIKDKNIDAQFSVILVVSGRFCSAFIVFLQANNQQPVSPYQTQPYQQFNMNPYGGFPPNTASGYTPPQPPMYHQQPFPSAPPVPPYSTQNPYSQSSASAPPPMYSTQS